jgi:hypothetical protein
MTYVEFGYDVICGKKKPLYMNFKNLLDFIL